MKTNIQKNTFVVVLSFLTILAFTFTSCQKEKATNATTDVQLHRNLSQAAVQQVQQANILNQRIAQTDYVYLLGVEPIEGPDEASASNGDIITLAGSGTFSINPKSVTGSGWFKHTNAAGAVLGMGTWSATQLISFHSYGNSFPDVPAELEGGLALIRIHLSPAAGGPGFDAVLQVDCLLGKPPAGAHEGIRLNVQDVINFNKEVEGETVFIRE